ncbi:MULTISPECIES: class I SAM-dependent methyltransferase [unclassified Mycolicibacterium]|uniref:class I SAM-dependent methyltransferase n=1 Tax=unclassified Mycolicibacterium TaxID=2636767 RepID=UPI0012DE934D|nr:MULTISPECIES: class I SAM-dependent methyltransferase [unclassified Mycolicibacterium]MUL84219.1 class I SAM-dependent methyltransferase [Mycolicibacterium sp. CBMA 329]MUL89715.1 class I SAM-dependent methyltransferase [Mycolicibacterium sp. CBMA 331]MUL99890.1 class I SAM-dependent methyltransferase [Mycolicibacterium sp. CBMA 334]MUM39230.1 class I SAM-dependent methyltransferase [Mycolicibacterium sp. CBMA 247]MUM46316.1 class I SAM-dependent methyltransferase [Mycolicibacterium sp. CBM
MAYMDSDTSDIDRMPRGGFRASWLDRLLETDRPEYLDRDSAGDERLDSIKGQVIGALDWTGRFFRNHQRFAAIALDLVADVPDPRILELGAGHGGVSRQLLADHPSARVTVTDVDADSVARIAASDLARHPRAQVRQMDATAIDAADGSYDLVLFALSFHHLRPAQAARVFAEGTRVADTLLIIDLPRPPAPLHLLGLATMLPAAVVLPFVHDGVISSLRSYSPSALRSLARHADPSIDVELRSGLNQPQIVIARAAGSVDVAARPRASWPPTSR